MVSPQQRRRLLLQPPRGQTTPPTHAETTNPVTRRKRTPKSLPTTAPNGTRTVSSACTVTPPRMPHSAMRVHAAATASLATPGSASAGSDGTCVANHSTSTLTSGSVAAAFDERNVSSRRLRWATATRSTDVFCSVPSTHMSTRFCPKRTGLWEREHAAVNAGSCRGMGGGERGGAPAGAPRFVASTMGRQKCTLLSRTFQPTKSTAGDAVSVNDIDTPVGSLPETVTEAPSALVLTTAFSNRTWFNTSRRQGQRFTDHPLVHCRTAGSATASQPVLSS